MPLFIALSLAICFMVQAASPLLSILETPVLIYISLTLAIISIFTTMFKILPGINWYDIFSSSVLLVWFAYWKPIFKDDSPIFFFYPLYFALFMAFVLLFFVGKRHEIDDESIRFMQSRSQKSILQPWVIMVCSLASLEFHQHFLLFPVMITLLIMRFALTSCLEDRCL